MPPRTVIGWPFESSPFGRFILPSGRMTTIESGSMRESTSRQVWSRSREIETTWAPTSLKNWPTIGRSDRLLGGRHDAVAGDPPEEPRWRHGDEEPLEEAGVIEEAEHPDAAPGVARAACRRSTSSRAVQKALEISRAVPRTRNTRYLRTAES